MSEAIDGNHNVMVAVLKEAIDRLRFMSDRIKIIEEAIGAGYIEGQDVLYQGSMVAPEVWLQTKA